MRSGFGFLAVEEAQLARLGALAERYFHDDPVTALIKLRQFAETMAALVAARNALAPGPRDSFDDTLRRLREAGRLPREAGDLFHDLRRLGNAAVHENRGGHAQALTGLKLARQLGVWFRRSYGGDPGFSPGPFVPPAPPQDATAPLLKELDALRTKLGAAERAERARRAAEALRAEAHETEAQRLGRQAEEAEFWRAYAEETEREKATLAERLAELQARAAQAPAPTVELRAAETAARRIVVDEADTRVLVDAQLNAAGWEADSLALRHSLGTRPEVGRRLAIAEWPAEGGKVDYALFIDERCVGVIEAKRENADVPAVLDQARRYAQTLRLASTELAPGAPYGGGWGEGNSAYRTPFVFATNGRPYVKQLETKSGVWFWDARRPTNPQVALPEWFSPEDLQARLAQKLDGATEALAEEPFDYAGLRPYQRRAVEAIEQAIADGRREILVAMATGTGKTRMAVALMYRLLKSGRFRRILFLVDRRALGEQAQGALDTTELEGLLKFSQTYNVAGLDKRTPDPEDRVQVATVQSLVAQVLGDEGPRPTPGRYDLIIVDEAHRGYVLDAELREDDLGFRDTSDYLSRYRRVLEHFDAVKVALTATPALHTTQIFGEPVFHYGYRQAVVDGFLADHLPPRRITTALSQAGISFEGGAEVEVVDARTGQIDLFHTPDQLDFDVAAFNRRVYTREFNRVVAEALAVEIAPDQSGKTLVFAARDDHADMLVEELSKALAKEYGPQPLDLVKKITSSVDRPLELIRRFKNDRLPQYVVTVDLLTTGIDVPSISNLVFARRVNSRILYDQMIGRATRLAPGKTTFRIFDAVDLYARLQSMSDMRPVVVKPELSFRQLADDLLRAPTDEGRRFVRDQIVVKLRARLKRLGPEAAKSLEAAAGQAPQAWLDWLKAAPVSAVADTLRERPAVVRQLDAADGETGEPRRIYISDHEDHLVGVEDVFTGAASPQDYITAFERFVRENMNLVPALIAATQRPRELTRAELKALASALGEKGFTEAELRRAYGRTRNADIAAHVIGFVRQAALGDPLAPYQTRVENALARIEASRPWTQTQRQWLRRIGRALLEQPVGDRELLEQASFKAQGGWPTVDRDFDDHLADVLGDLNEAIWTSGGAA